MSQEELPDALPFLSVEETARTSRHSPASLTLARGAALRFFTHAGS